MQTKDYIDRAQYIDDIVNLNSI